MYRHANAVNQTFGNLQPVIVYHAEKWYAYKSSHSPCGDVELNSVGNPFGDFRFGSVNFPIFHIESDFVDLLFYDVHPDIVDTPVRNIVSDSLNQPVGDVVFVSVVDTFGVGYSDPSAWSHKQYRS